MSYLFAYCYQLKELIFTLGDITSIKFMSNSFRNCTSLENLDLSFYTHYVEDMSSLFYGCISLANIYILSFSTAFSVNSKYMNS